MMGHLTKAETELLKTALELLDVILGPRASDPEWQGLERKLLTPEPRRTSGLKRLTKRKKRVTGTTK